MRFYKQNNKLERKLNSVTRSTIRHENYEGNIYEDMRGRSTQYNFVAGCLTRIFHPDSV